jgi:pyruvate dehydrogenase phosphatase regulatory subunit
LTLPAEHYHLHTKPTTLLAPDSPVVRDPDGHIYFRENGGRVLAGGFAPIAKPAFEDGVLPSSSTNRQLTPDYDHFAILLENLLKRVPTFGDCSLETLKNGPEGFSPDGQWILGQAPEIQNYYVAAAMRSIGIYF